MLKILDERDKLELTQRIDNIIISGTSTEGNAELIDIRLKADGAMGTSAGSAVREQILEIKEDLNKKASSNIVTALAKSLSDSQVDIDDNTDNINKILSDLEIINKKIDDSSKIAQTILIYKAFTYINLSGEEVTESTSGADVKHRTTDYIALAKGDKIEYSNLKGDSSISLVSVYDVDKKFLYSWESGSHNMRDNFTAQDQCYVRLCTIMGAQATVIIYRTVEELASHINQNTSDINKIKDNLNEIDTFQNNLNTNINNLNTSVNNLNDDINYQANNLGGAIFGSQLGIVHINGTTNSTTKITVPINLTFKPNTKYYINAIEYDGQFFDSIIIYSNSRSPIPSLNEQYYVGGTSYSTAKRFKPGNTLTFETEDKSLRMMSVECNLTQAEPGKTFSLDIQEVVGYNTSKPIISRLDALEEKTSTIDDIALDVQNNKNLINKVDLALDIQNLSFLERGYYDSFSYNFVSDSRYLTSNYYLITSYKNNFRAITNWIDSSVCLFTWFDENFDYIIGDAASHKYSLNTLISAPEEAKYVKFTKIQKISPTSTEETEFYLDRKSYLQGLENFQSNIDNNTDNINKIKENIIDIKDNIDNIQSQVDNNKFDITNLKIAATDILYKDFTERNDTDRVIVNNEALSYASLDMLGGMSMKAINIFDKDSVKESDLKSWYIANHGTILAYPNHPARLLILSCKPNSTYTMWNMLPSTKRIGTFVNEPLPNAVATNYAWTDTISLDPLEVTSGPNDKYLIVQFLTDNDTSLDYRDYLPGLVVAEGSWAFFADPPYEPYSDRLLDAKVDKVVSYGANLIDPGAVRAVTNEESKLDLAIGTLNSSDGGVNLQVNNRVYDKTFYTLSRYSFTPRVTSTTQYLAMCYDIDSQYLGWTGWCTTNDYTLPDGTAYVRFSLAYRDGRNITESNIDTLRDIITLTNTRDKFLYLTGSKENATLYLNNPTVQYTLSFDSSSITAPVANVFYGLKKGATVPSLISGTLTNKNGTTTLTFLPPSGGMWSLWFSNPSTEYTVPTKMYLGKGAQPIEVPIPQAVIAKCPDYGIGINGTLYNYIDFVEKKYYHNVGSVDLGSLYWTYDPNYTRFSATPVNIAGTARTVPILCAKYDALVNGEAYDYDWDKVIYVSAQFIFIHDKDYDTATNFKADLLGTFAYYRLATPEVIDLSDVLIDNVGIVSIEPGGMFEFHYPEKDNGFTIETPSKITYKKNMKTEREQMFNSYLKNDPNVWPDFNAEQQATICQKLGLISSKGVQF